MRELNYTPDRLAASFASGRSRTIGIIVPSLGNTVYNQAIEAAERRLQADRYQLLTASSGYEPIKELETATALVEHGVDGLILVGNVHLAELYDLVERMQVPTVQTFVNNADSRLPSIGFDNFQPVFDLTSHVLTLGHRHMAILHSPTKNNDRILARVQAIQAAMRHHGIEPDPELIIEAGITVDDGRSGMRALLRTGREFTAVACSGDVIAIGAVIEAQASGLLVPRDVSVSGFHDYDLASVIEPPLTTVHAPIREMAAAAVQYLLSVIEGDRPPRTRTMPTSMVLRKSVGPPPPGR